MADMVSLAALTDDLAALGLRRGDVVMVHSSFKSLGIQDPEVIIGALQRAIGVDGTLLMPALTWTQEPPTVHDTRTTPGCVGFLPEYFRRRPGTLRSLHPTHSVCGIGANLDMWLDHHREDTSPCGPHSPFRLLTRRGGRILMLGCGLGPNTTMHAIEEDNPPPYLFGPPIVYRITDVDGTTFEKVYTPHDFAGVEQRYDRVGEILGPPDLRHGRVGAADAFLIDAIALRAAALVKLRDDPYWFVDRVPETGRLGDWETR